MCAHANMDGLWIIHLLLSNPLTENLGQVDVHWVGSSPPWTWTDEHIAAHIPPCGRPFCTVRCIINYICWITKQAAELGWIQSSQRHVLACRQTYFPPSIMQKSFVRSLVDITNPKHGNGEEQNLLLLSITTQIHRNIDFYRTNSYCFI